MCAVSKKILLILAIWFVNGGLAFADTIDLADELRSALPEWTQAVEIDLDEVRELVEDGLVPVAHLCPVSSPVRSTVLAPLFDFPSQAARRPLHEILRIFKI